MVCGLGGDVLVFSAVMISICHVGDSFQQPEFTSLDISS